MTKQFVFDIYWGCAADPIDEQMKNLHFPLPEQTCNRFEKIRQALLVLKLNDVLSYSVGQKATEKANKMLVKEMTTIIDAMSSEEYEKLLEKQS